jgi:hypothetical protein
VAYVVHRLVEQPILARRRAVEASTAGRCCCTALQVAPIGLGLLLLFPWTDLAMQIRALPNLFVVVGGLGIALIAARALQLRQSGAVQLPQPHLPMLLKATLHAADIKRVA